MQSLDADEGLTRKYLNLQKPLAHVLKSLLR